MRGKKRCRLHGGLSTGPKTSEGKARTVAAMVEGRRRLLEKLKAEGKPVPWGRKRGGANRSAAERQLAQATKRYARARRDLEAFLSQKFRRQRRQTREVVKCEVERLLRSTGAALQTRLPPLSPEQRQTFIEGFRQRVVVPAMTARCRGPTFRCCKIGCARLMTPWSERKPKLPSIKKRPLRSQRVGCYIHDFIRCSNFWNCARFRRAIT